ncbi:MAG: DUF4153 domain-containing protein [Nitrospirae bacterium]|nr:DUF4153 domain-containing protein [Nitrospirota bacterium]NTW67972.1 DUF4153 domain-containing protein [Nitrospirota bacterium]
MKISIQELWQNMVATTRRFPLAVTDSVIVTLLALALNSLASKSTVIEELLVTAVLGFPLLLSLALFSEGRAVPEKLRQLSPLLAVLFLAVHYFFLKSPERGSDAIRTAAFFLAFLCFLSFAPYARAGGVDAFWRYNKSLVVGASVAGLASIALMAGIGLALAGMDYLLGVSFPQKLYSRLWIISSCLLWPCVFLAAIPRDLDQLDAPEAYSKGMEIFNRYIVVPLVLVYMLILYLYTGKIILQTSWPKGGVAGYILGFSAVGLLSVVLIHPLKDREGNTWIKTYLNWLCIFILPQTVVLFLSVWRRVSEYGVTEIRYFGILAAFLLAGICGYLLFSRTKSIKIIPVTLCLAALLSAVGPWSAAGVSERSQFKRLVLLLEKDGLLINGKAAKATKLVSHEEQAAISAVVQYLHERHGMSRLQGLFTQDLASTNAKDRPQKMMDLMGLSYIPTYDAEGKQGHQQHFSFYAKKQGIRRVSGYDYFLRFKQYSGYQDLCRDDGSSQTCSMDIEGKKYAVTLKTSAAQLIVVRDEQVLGTLDLMTFARKLRKRQTSPGSQPNVPQEEMVLEGKAGNVAIKMIFWEVHMVERKDNLDLTGVNADVLMKIKE